MMRHKDIGIIWDLDGTLVDTEQAHYETWRTALLSVGVELTRETFTYNFGKNNVESLPNYLGYEPDDALAARLSDLKEALFIEKYAKDVPLFEGALHWLDVFKDSGYRQAIASSAPMLNIDTIVDARKIRPYFQALLSGFALPSKPSPVLFLKAAELMRIVPDNCIVIEDAPAGLMGGHNAGMKTIALASSHPVDSLIADLVLADFSYEPHKAIAELLDH